MLNAIDLEHLWKVLNSATMFLHSIVMTNRHGGMYEQGKYYSYAFKTNVYQHYYKLVNSCFYEKNTARQLSVAAKVSRGYAHNVLKEIQTYRVILHPTLKI